MATKFKPLHDNVLVRRNDAPEQTESGLYIPPTSQEKQSKGEVIATGTGTVLDDGSVRPLAVKAGDVVLFGKFAGTEIQIEGEEFLIMREMDILGVIDV